MGGYTNVESKIGVGTKFIINTKVKCRRVSNFKYQSDSLLFDSSRSDKIMDKFVFISKDNKEAELTNFV